MAAKTNAVRILERAGIAFELREYVYDERTFSAEDAARQVGMPPERVFKTLLLHGDRSGHLFALIPAAPRSICAVWLWHRATSASS